MKIIIDMNLSPLWVKEFEKNGWHAVHWSDVGEPSASDAEIFQWAKIKNYVVFTHDLDFGAILAATNAESPSVIQIRTQDTMPAALGEKVIDVLNSYEDTLKKGALITVDEIKARIRILPIN